MRPCADKHPEPIPATCRRCYNWLYDQRYRTLWGGDGEATHPPADLAGRWSGEQIIRPAGRCAHLGQDTGERRLCGSCRGKVSLKVFACSHPDHGKTTLTGCERCRDFQAPAPVGGEPVRNLLYHIMPMRANGTWQRNLDQLKARWHVFTGRKIVAVVTDPRCDPPEAVRAYLDRPDVTWIIKPNNPLLGEVWTWDNLWQSLDARPGITFYGHAKGVTHPVNDGVGVHRWVDVMYRSCLDYLPFVERLLQSYPIAGSFKKNSVRPASFPWHYSGTFYWVRTADGLAHYRRRRQGWAGTELWPGDVWKAEQGGVIFKQGRMSNLNLYHLHYMTKIIEPQFRRWQLAHEHQQTAKADSTLAGG